MTTTVIIVNWNSGALLMECLMHLSRQSVQPEKVFVVDNASSDASLGNVNVFPCVSVLRSDTNLGFSGGNNLALSECDTEYIALLNPDAFPEPDWLEHLLVKANQNPEYAAFGSRQVCASDSKMLDGVGDSYHLSGLVWRDRHGSKLHADDLVEKEIFSPCAAAALFRRKALIDVGGFDEDYFCYVEDVDLGFRLRLAGYRAMYVPDAVVYHIGSATTGGKRSEFSIYHGHRNLVWTFVKDMPGVLLWILLPLHIVMNVMTVAFFIFRGQGQVILQAKLDAIKGLPKMLRKRQAIQANRIATVGEIWQVLNKRLWPTQR